jgi:hypothetical protein
MPAMAWLAAAVVVPLLLDELLPQPATATASARRAAAIAALPTQRPRILVGLVAKSSASS